MSISGFLNTIHAVGSIFDAQDFSSKWGVENNVKKDSQSQARKFSRKIFYQINLLLEARDYWEGE